MGVEYKIKFEIKDKKTIEEFLVKLSPTFENEVTILLREDGFYFCDNLINQTVSANIFYRLIRKASSQNNEVKIYEL